MLIGLIVVGFFLLSKSPFSWHLRNLLFPSQRLRKQTFGDPYCTHYFLCWEEIDPSTSVYGTGWGMMPVWSCFPRPVLPWSAGSPWRWAEELAKTPKRSHFLLAALCLAELLLTISAFVFLLSLFGKIPDTHSPLCFPPWHAEEVKAAEKGSLLTCQWMFLSSFIEQIKLLNEELYFGKAKHGVVSGLVLNSHMFPGYNSLFLLVSNAFQSPFHPAEE